MAYSTSTSISNGPATSVLRAPDYYKRLTPTIHEVTQEVGKVKEGLKLTFRKLMIKVVDYMVGELKEVNQPFMDVYRDTRNVGSFFNGMTPIEYSTYIILQFPFRRKCEVKQFDDGFYQVRAEPGRAAGGYDFPPNLVVDKRGFIRRDKVLDWWRYIFSNALPNTPRHRAFIDEQHFHLTWANSGSGVRIIVESEFGQVVMNIDMVPVIRFANADAYSPSPVYDSWLSRMQKNGHRDIPKHWYIFPKPQSSDDTDSSNLLWGLSFWDQEKEIMWGKYHLKPANRLLKKLRDNYNWNLLTSYHIKTLCLHEKFDEDLMENNTGYQLVRFLSKLAEALEKHELEYYWNPSINLLREIPYATCYNWSVRIHKILDKFHRHLNFNNPAQLKLYARELFIGAQGTPDSTVIFPVCPREDDAEYSECSSISRSSSGYVYPAYVDTADTGSMQDEQALTTFANESDDTEPQSTNTVPKQETTKSGYGAGLLGGIFVGGAAVGALAAMWMMSPDKTQNNSNSNQPTETDNESE